MSCTAKSCPFWDTEGCNYADPSECDLAKVFPPEEKDSLPFAPLYMRFSYQDEWRHIPMLEVYPVWTQDDFMWSVYVFREKHQSQGALIAFATEDLIEWRKYGEVPAE